MKPAAFNLAITRHSQEKRSSYEGYINASTIIERGISGIGITVRRVECRNRRVNAFTWWKMRLLRRWQTVRNYSSSFMINCSCLDWWVDSFPTFPQGWSVCFLNLYVLCYFLINRVDINMNAVKSSEIGSLI